MGKNASAPVLHLRGPHPWLLVPTQIFGRSPTSPSASSTPSTPRARTRSPVTGARSHQLHRDRRLTLSPHHRAGRPAAHCGDRDEPRRRKEAMSMPSYDQLTTPPRLSAPPGRCFGVDHCGALQPTHGSGLRDQTGFARLRGLHVLESGGWAPLTRGRNRRAGRHLPH